MRIVLLLIMVSAFFISCGGGTYHPGELAGSSHLTVPDQRGVRENFWKVGVDTELYHFTRGEKGGKPVLMVHGGPSVPFAGPWPGLESLEGYEFHYYHQRGGGKSTIPFQSFPSKNYGKNLKLLEEKLGLARHIEDMEKIRLILGADRLILVGHSFGGFLAVLYALEYPGKVEKLVLIEPADMLRMPTGHGGMEQIERWLNEEQNENFRVYMKDYFNYGRFFKRTETELAALNGRYGDFYFQALSNRFSQLPDLPRFVEEVSGNGGFAGHSPFFSLGRQYDYREKLRDIDIPALIIHGKKDLFGPETGLEYAEYLPRSRYTEMEGSSHFPFYEEPEYFREILSAFLNNK